MSEYNEIELKNILEEHEKWIYGSGEKRANFREANLEGVNLEGANLEVSYFREANLRGANLRGANLDFSIMNFSCKDLGHHIDDRLAIQRLYHALYNINYSKYVSHEIKNALLTPHILEIANRFHRVDECGKIIKNGREDE